MKGLPTERTKTSTHLKHDQNDDGMGDNNFQSQNTNLFLFSIILGLVFIASVVLIIKIVNIFPYKTNIVPFPTINEMGQNLKLLLDGYWGGYGRTLKGFFYFSIMVSSFIACGYYFVKLISNTLLKTAQPLKRLSTWENLALYYIFGSLIYSLLWFSLSLAGILTKGAAITLCVIGVTFFIHLILNSWKSYRTTTHKSFKFTVRSWVLNMSIFEKILTLTIFFIAVLFITSSIFVPRQGDTLITHMALPNYYIYQGGLIPNPFHFHSYFPQNTEMLALWAILLDSEVAASLLILGFHTAFAMMIFGFVKRYTSYLPAISSVLIFYSIPIIGHSAMIIKNDIPVSLFIFAHYCLLIECFSSNKTSIKEPKLWILLAGLLGGGAIGHKLTGVPIIGISTLAIIIYEIYSLSKSKSHSFIIPYWILGIFLTASPWLIRTTIETGNPIFPLLNSLFGSKISDPLYSNVENKFYFDMTSMQQMKNYGLSLLYGFGENSLPSWGPSIFLLVLSSFALLSKWINKGFKFVIGACLLSFLLLLVSSEVRFSMGLISFLTIICFSLFYERSLKSRYYKIFKITIPIVLYCGFIGAFLYVATILKASFNVFISGYSPGNVLPIGERSVENMRWMTHLINSKASDNGNVLYAGINYGYGLQRKFYYSSGFDRGILTEVAKVSKNSDELLKHLNNKGIKHLLISNTFFSDFENHKTPEIRTSVQDLQKINDLITQNTVTRAVSPDKSIKWLSLLKKEGDYKPIEINSSDIIDYPIMAILQAESEYADRNLGEAKSILEKASSVPMMPQYKTRVRELFASTLADLGTESFQQNKFDQAQKYYEQSLDHNPNNYLVINNIGVAHNNMGNLNLAIKHYKKAIELGSAEKSLRSL